LILDHLSGVLVSRHECHGHLKNANAAEVSVVVYFVVVVVVFVAAVMLTAVLVVFV
jgi:hypothetical protein